MSNDTNPDTRRTVAAPIGAEALPPLPDFMRRDIERAIKEAAHPKGMSVHDGKARIGGDRLQRLLLIADSAAERIRVLESELAERKQPAGSIGDDPEFRKLLAYVQGWQDGAPILSPDSPIGSASRRLIAHIDGRTAGTAWISVADRLPEVGELVLVYSPPTKYDHPGEVNISFDCIDPDADEPSWLSHNEHYEHFCCVAKPEGSVGPSEHAPYTHWMPLAAAPSSLSGTEVANADQA